MLVLWKGALKGYFLWPVHSLDKILLAFVCFILYSKAKLAYYSRYLLTSYFCLPVSMMKKTFFFFFCICSRRSCRTGLEGLVELVNLSFFSISGWGINFDYRDVEWIVWKQVEIILSFLRLYPSTITITADGDCSHEIKRQLLLGRKVMTNLDSILKSRDITLSSQGYGFCSSHVWMWELDYKESWAPKN